MSGKNKIYMDQPRPTPTTSTTTATTHYQTLVGLMETYHDLNTPWVERLDHPPTPVEFSELVRRNRPVIISNGCSHWPAMSKWDVCYLKEQVKGDINIACTPLG